MASSATTDSVLSLQEAADELGVHYMTAYRYVRTGRLAADQRNGVWQVSRDALDAFAAKPSGTTRAPQRSRVRARLLDRLTRGDEAGAWNGIEDVLAGGATPSQIIREILLPVMKTIGDRWQAGDLSVADEHIASAVMARLVARLGPLAARRGRSRGTVILGAVSGDHHALPSLFLADLLRADGFDVLNLGADTPVESFVQTVQHADRLVSVGIGVTAEGLDAEVERTVAAVKGAVDVPVCVGGGAISGGEHATSLGADAWSGTLDGALNLLSGKSPLD